MTTSMRLAPNSETFEHGLFPLHAPGAVAPARLLRLARELPRTIGQHEFVQLASAVLGLDKSHGAILAEHFSALHGLARGAAVPSRGLLLYLFVQGYQQTVVRSPVKSQEEIGDTWPQAQALSRAAVQPSARVLAVNARGSRRLGEQARDRLAWLARHVDFLVEVLRSCNREPGATAGAEPPVGAAGAARTSELAATLSASDLDLLGVLLEMTVVTLAAADVRAPSQARISSAFSGLGPHRAAAAGAEGAGAEAAAAAPNGAGEGAPALLPAQVHAELLALLSDAASFAKSPRLPALPGAALLAGAAVTPASPLGSPGGHALHGGGSPGGGGAPESPTRSPVRLSLPFPSLGSLSVSTGEEEIAGAAAAGGAAAAAAAGARLGLLGGGVMLSHAHSPTHTSSTAGGSSASACGSLSPGNASPCAAAGGTAAAAVAAAVAAGAAAVAAAGAAGAGATISGSRLHISGLHRRTQLIERAALGPSPATACEVVVVDCHQSFIYLLAPVRSVLVLGCTSCTLVIGAVSRCISLEHSERLRVHCACAALRLANCIECTAYLCCNRRPILTGENHRVCLAPYNTFFPSLGADLAAAAIATHLAANCWDRPVAFSAPDAPVPPAVAAPLPADRFLPFTVPFELGAHATGGGGPPGEAACETAGNPCEMPEEYMLALAAAKQRLQTFQAHLQRISAPAVREEVQAAVHRRFKEWLVKSGHMRQVHDLMALEHARAPP